MFIDKYFLLKDTHDIYYGEWFLFISEIFLILSFIIGGQDLDMDLDNNIFKMVEFIEDISKMINWMVIYFFSSKKIIRMVINIDKKLFKIGEGKFIYKNGDYYEGHFLNG